MPAPVTADGELRPFTDRDREILAFERGVWKYQGAKESEVMARFGWSLTRYFQVLNVLLDHPDAEAYDAVTIRRLRRLRDVRRGARTARRVG